MNRAQSIGSISLIFALAGCGVSSTAASLQAARTTTLISCDGGEDIQLTIKQLANGKLRANVTEQSFGDSYPTFHYSVRESESSSVSATFSGGGFTLTVNTNPAGNSAPSHLSIPAQGVDQDINCTLQGAHLD